MTIPGSDEIIARYEGASLSDRRFLHSDERGSVIAETNGTGIALYQNTYNTDGNPGAANAGRVG